jgi:hypothetical protein
MKFKERIKELADTVNQAKFKDWKVTGRTFFRFSWEWIWKFCVICVTAVMGCYWFAGLNDMLSSYKGESIHGTWMWPVFGVMYFATLIFILFWIGTYKKK